MCDLCQLSYKLKLYFCGIQTLDLEHGRALSTTLHLEKEMYWNDKYNKGEDVRFPCFFFGIDCRVLSYLCHNTTLTYLV